jgi:hypothetical protein
LDDTKRIWATVPAADAEALERVAAARGLRSSDLLREAMSALIGTRTQTGDASQLAPVTARLESLAEKLERQTQALQIALDLAYASEGERKDVREALTDIAMSIGVLAGSIEPAETADNF